MRILWWVVMLFGVVLVANGASAADLDGVISLSGGTQPSTNVRIRKQYATFKACADGLGTIVASIVAEAKKKKDPFAIEGPEYIDGRAYMSVSVTTQHPSSEIRFLGSCGD